MACCWARDPFSRTEGGADVPFSPSGLQRQNLLEFELEASQRHLQRATQSSGSRDLGSLASSMLSWLERQQGCHWGLTTLRDGVSSSPVPAGSQAIHSCQEVLETWTYVVFLLIYFPLLACPDPGGPREGLSQRKAEKGAVFSWLLQFKSLPFQRNGKTSRHSFHSSERGCFLSPHHTPRRARDSQGSWEAQSKYRHTSEAHVGSVPSHHNEVSHMNFLVSQCI